MASSRVTRKMSRQMSVAAEASNAAMPPAPARAPTPAPTTTKTASKKRSINETEPDLPPTQQKRAKQSDEKPKTRKTKASSATLSAQGSNPTSTATTATKTAAANKSTAAATKKTAAVTSKTAAATTEAPPAEPEAHDVLKPNQDIVPGIASDEIQDAATGKVGEAEAKAREGSKDSQSTEIERDSDEVPSAESKTTANAEDEQKLSGDNEAEPEEGGRRLRSSRLRARKQQEAETTAKPTKKRKAAALAESSGTDEDREPVSKKMKKIWRPDGMGDEKGALKIEVVRKFGEQFAGDPARYDDSLEKMGPVGIRSFENWIKMQPVFEPEPAACQPEPAEKGMAAAQKKAKAQDDAQDRKNAKAAHDKWVKERQDGPQPIVEHFRISDECDQRRLQASLDRAARKTRKKDAKGDYHPEIANNRLPGNDDVVSPINAYQDLWIVRQAFDLDYENTIWMFTNPKPGLPLPNNIQCGVGDVKARMQQVSKQKLLEKVEVEPESEDGLAALEMVQKWAKRQGGGGYTLGEETYGEWNALHPQGYIPVEGNWRAVEVLEKWGEEGAPK
jgi:hypothetical protein